MKYTLPLIALVLLLLSGCDTGLQPATDPTSPAVPPSSAPARLRPRTLPGTAPTTPARAILNDVLEAHGGNRYDSAAYRFVFRDKVYTFENDGASYRYTRSYEKDGAAIVDVLDNTGFSRTANGEPVPLTAKETASGSEAVNSVIYFATLPHKLTDPAVNLVDDGTATVKGQSYRLLRVHFDEEGGGTDHDDNFLYWVNDDTGRIDYLAYDYRVNGGGVRFRSAYNPRVVEGILFQDYVNYKAPVGTPLNALSEWFEQGKLKELSRIETEKVTTL